MRIVFGCGYIAAYLVWIIYRLVLRQDLKQHLTDFYALSFLIVVWFIIYMCLYA